MKICIVCPRLCHGGAERVAVSLANGFAGKGYQVSFLTDLFEEQTYVLHTDVAVRNLVAKPRPKSLKWLSAFYILRKWLRKDRPDVVIGIMSLCSIIAWISSLGLTIPVIATEHDSYEKPASAPMTKWGRLYKFYISRFFKCVTVLTEADKKLIGGRLKNVVVMPNPLAIEPSKSVPPKKNVILAAGRVDNWYVKGFDILLRAWTKAVTNLKFQVSYEEWNLQIAGVWRSDETVRYLTGLLPDGDWTECDGNLKSDKYHVEFLGFVEDMKPKYEDSSIFVLSSRYEGFGLVLIEAMSQGCACVACDYKGRQREIICPDGANESFMFQDPSSYMSSAKNQDSSNVVSSSENQVPKELEPETTETCNLKLETHLQPETTPLRGVEVCENGILCEPDNVEALAEGIKRMMEDEEYRKGVQKNSIERSKAYSIDYTIQRWESLLKHSL